MDDFALEFRLGIEGINEHERPAITHTHVLIVGLHGKDHIVSGDIGNRNFGRVIVQRRQDK